MIYFWHQSAAPWGRHPMQTAVLWLCWCRGGEGNPTDSDQSNPAIQIKKKQLSHMNGAKLSSCNFLPNQN